MSKTNVDVLAVMDAEISAAMDACKSVHGSARLTALVEARAAVAELGEAAQGMRAFLDLLRTGSTGAKFVTVTSRGQSQVNVAAVLETLNAALAAFEVRS